MSASFIGEIRMMGATFAPVHWAFCSGSLITPNSNQALFSLLGTFYGGNGRTSFALPDMRSRIPMHFGQGPGLTPRPIGQRGGEDTVALTTSTMPAHTHEVKVSTQEGDSYYPAERILAAVPAADNRNLYIDVAASSDIKAMSESTIQANGSGTPHVNLMPVQCVNFIIALMGEYPQRS